MDKKKVVLALLFVILHLSYGKNDSNSEEEVTCTENNQENCVESIQTEGSWRPFQLGSKSRWVSLENAMIKYAKWHNKTLFSSDVQCREKKILVFKPNAGLGDSIGAITAAFQQSIRSGRLFFIHWQPLPWNVGLKGLPFEYDYLKVKEMLGSDGKPLICANDVSSFLTGHVTSAHKILNDDTVNDVNFGYTSLITNLINPSPKVDEIVQQVLSGDLSQSNDEFSIRTVAIVLRTGLEEYSQFLSRGDEMNFVKCFRNYARNVVKKEPASKKLKFRVFVTSDVESVKENAINELKNVDRNEGLLVDVVTLTDSIIHVMHIEKDKGKKKSIRDKVRKTYAEYFLIANCQVKFLTHGSLFGRSAAERTDNGKDYYISDSNCDGTREKYSYLKCHEPKYPKICELN